VNDLERMERLETLEEVDSMEYESPRSHPNVTPLDLTRVVSEDITNDSARAQARQQPPCYIGGDSVFEFEEARGATVETSANSDGRLESQFTPRTITQWKKRGSKSEFQKPEIKKVATFKKVRSLRESTNMRREWNMRVSKHGKNVRVRYDPNKVKAYALVTEALSLVRAVCTTWSGISYLIYLALLNVTLYFCMDAEVTDVYIKEVIPSLNTWFGVTSFLSSLALSFYLNAAYQRYNSCFHMLTAMENSIQSAVRTSALVICGGIKIQMYCMDTDNEAKLVEKDLSPQGILLLMSKHYSLAHHLVFKVMAKDSSNFTWLREIELLDPMKESLIKNEEGGILDVSYKMALNWALEVLLTAFNQKQLLYGKAIEEVADITREFEKGASELLQLRDNPIPFPYYVIVQLTVTATLVILPCTLFYNMFTLWCGVVLCFLSFVGYQSIILVANSLSYPFVGSRINLAVLQSLNHTLEILCTLILPGSMLSPDTRKCSADSFTPEEWDEYMRLSEAVMQQRERINEMDRIKTETTVIEDRPSTIRLSTDPWAHRNPDSVVRMMRPEYINSNGALPRAKPEEWDITVAPVSGTGRDSSEPVNLTDEVRGTIMEKSQANAKPMSILQTLLVKAPNKKSSRRFMKLTGWIDQTSKATGLRSGSFSRAMNTIDQAAAQAQP